MPIVHFTDSSGREWEVMEVRPSSTSRLAVTEGHESGWLAFRHGDERRRFAPVPDGWQEFDAPALGALCEAARRVERVTEFPFRERRQAVRAVGAADVDSVHVAATPEAMQVKLPPELHDLTREAANASKENDETVVAGLLNLRRLLTARDVAPNSDTFRAARQLFLETYFFRGS